MGTVNDVLRIAASQVGYDRYDDPQQGTKYGRWYAEYTGVPYFGTNGVPYCAMFVSWVLNQASVKCPLFPTAVAFDMGSKSRMAGRYVDKYSLKAGDVVAFDWDDDDDGDHVGFVEKVYSNYIQTIEGNTGDGQVLRRTRYHSSIICGVRPYYDGTGGKLDVDGWIGTLSVSEWQEQRGTTVDGILSGQTRSEDEYRSHVVAVDYAGKGSELVLSVQRFLMARGLYKGGADGLWGYETSCGIQRYLKGLGYYTGGIDGDFAGHSAECLQRSLNDKKWRA